MCTICLAYFGAVKYIEGLSKLDGLDVAFRERDGSPLLVSASALICNTLESSVYALRKCVFKLN